MKSEASCSEDQPTIELSNSAIVSMVSGMGESDRFRDGRRALVATLLAHGLIIALLAGIWIDRSRPLSPRLIAQSSPSAEIPETGEAAPVPMVLTRTAMPNASRPIPTWDAPSPNFATAPYFSRTELAPSHIPIFPESLASPFPRVPLSRSSLPKSSSPPEIDAIGTVPVTGWTGIELTMDQQYQIPRIVRVIPGGPAQRQGILGTRHHGDFIVTVDGQSTRHRALEETQRLIVGEADTMVALGLCRFPGSVVSVVKIRRGR